MKQLPFILYFVLLSLVIWVAVKKDLSAQPPKQFTNLTQLSPREWVDLSKVTYVQLPVYVPVPGCVDCAARWGSGIIVDGVRIEYSEEAEVEVRRLLNVK